MAAIEAAAGPAIHDSATTVDTSTIRVPTVGVRFLVAQQSAVRLIVWRPAAPPDHKRREHARVYIEAIHAVQGEL
jgi:hypothetical protein